MFVYQNKDRAICVTFKDNKPVENPEYVITIDKEAGTLTVNGASTVVAPAEEQTKEGNTVIPEDESKVEEPVVDEE